MALSWEPRYDDWMADPEIPSPDEFKLADYLYALQFGYADEWLMAQDPDALPESLQAIWLEAEARRLMRQTA